MKKINKVISFVDGFNLYHSIRELGSDKYKKPIPNKNHLKWVDLWCLSSRYANKESQKLIRVLYFSAFATWLSGPYSRHRKYVKGLQNRGVEFIKGKFKDKERECKTCGATWVGHEEKETDVNIGIHLLNEAYKNSFDHAILISADSDLSPAVKLIKKTFPSKLIYVVIPPKVKPSKELIQAAGGYQFSRNIKESHIAKCILPAEITNQYGQLIVKRPREYDPVLQ